MSGTEKSSVEVVYGRLHEANLLGFTRSLAQQRGVPLMALIGRRRSPQVSGVRFELWTVLRDTLALSFPEIGMLFDRDHSTVLVGIEAHRRKLDRRYAPLAKASL